MRSAGPAVSWEARSGPHGDGDNDDREDAQEEKARRALSFFSTDGFRHVDPTTLPAHWQRIEPRKVPWLAAWKSSSAKSRACAYVSLSVWAAMFLRTGCDSRIPGASCLSQSILGRPELFLY